MSKWLQRAGIALIVLTTIFFVVKIFQFFWPRGNEDLKIFSQLMSVEKTNVLYTGFSYVSVLKLKKDNSNTVGYLYRLYEVAFGYSDLSRVVSDYNQAEASIPSVEILSINAQHSDFGGNAHQKECDLLDLCEDGNRDAQKKLIQDQMIEDKQWDVQNENGKKILKSFLNVFGQSKPEATQNKIHENKMVQASHTEAANSILPSYLGSLKITFSLLALSNKPGFLFFSKNGFYIRKDIADVTYGSKIFANNIRLKRPFLGKEYLYFELEYPKLLSIDRYISILDANRSTYDPVNEDERRKGNDLENELMSKLEVHLKKINRKAVELSQTLLNINIFEMTKELDLPIRIEYKKRLSEEELSLGELSEAIQ